MKIRNSLLLLFFLTVAIAVIGQDDLATVPHQYLLQLKPNTNISALNFDENTTVAAIAPAMNIWLVTIKNDNAQTLQKLRSHKAVRLAQYNHQLTSRSFIPTDPYFTNQWSLLNTGQSGIVGVDIAATKAWDISHNNITAAGDTIVIAVLENGMDLNHEDINIFYNYNEIPGDGIDNDNNGYIDDFNGWDVTLNANYVSGNSNYHAIHVAGITGAIGNNGKGIAGVCMGVKILPVTHGAGDVEADAVKAYNYILTMRQLYDTTNGAKGAFVVATNSSFGIGAYGADPAGSPIWCAMYDSLGKYGILNAVAAPNANVDVDVVHDVPSECPSDFVISVTNTNSSDNRYASGAAWGKKSIDLGAPGTSIYSLFPSNSYNYLSGTSMSTPHVAGAVGACFGMACSSFIENYKNNPATYAAFIKNAILNGTTLNYSLEHKTVSDGRLNLYQTFLKMQEFDCDSCGFSPTVIQHSLQCKNDSNATLSVYPKGENYLWNNGATQDSIAELKNGVYTVKITDGSGCSLQRTAIINNPKSISVNAININPVTTVANGNIIAGITSGNDTMQYSIGGTFQTGNIFTITTSGYYTLTARNQSGCELDTIVFVDFINGIADDVPQLLGFFPNPAADVITIKTAMSSQDGIPCQITDLSGKIILATTINSSIVTMDVSQLSAGYYIFSWMDNKKKLTSQPLLIVRQGE